jgi:hypothetical protein
LDIFGQEKLDGEEARGRDANGSNDGKESAEEAMKREQRERVGGSQKGEQSRRKVLGRAITRERMV